MKQYMVILIDMNVAELMQMTKPYFETGWRDTNISDMERKIRDYLSLSANEEYIERVIAWLYDCCNGTANQALQMEYDTDVWFFATVEL